MTTLSRTRTRLNDFFMRVYLALLFLALAAARAGTSLYARLQARRVRRNDVVAAASFRSEARIVTAQRRLRTDLDIDSTHAADEIARARRIRAAVNGIIASNG